MRDLFEFVENFFVRNYKAADQLQSGLEKYRNRNDPFNWRAANNLKNAGYAVSRIQSNDRCMSSQKTAAKGKDVY